MGILTLRSFLFLSFVLFGYAHLGYEDNNLTLGTYILGAIWGVLNFFQPNLILVSISHAVIGVYAFSQGVIKEESFLHPLASLKKL